MSPSWKASLGKIGTQKVMIEQYKLYVKQFEEYYLNRYKVIAVYFSVTAGLLAYFQSDNSLSSKRLIGILIACICFVWIATHWFWRKAQKARLKVILQMECCLPFQPYRREEDSYTNWVLGINPYSWTTRLEYLVPTTIILLSVFYFIFPNP